jgi:hypothetical protein
MVSSDTLAPPSGSCPQWRHEMTFVQFIGQVAVPVLAFVMLGLAMLAIFTPDP